MNRQTRDVCPAWTGAVGNGVSSLVPDTDTVVLPLSLMCMDIEPRTANYYRGTPYTGANIRLRFSPVAAGGVLAWDLGARRPAWRVDERLPVLGGTLATSGGLVFYGTLDGKFKALDARTGALLWQSSAAGRGREPAGAGARPRRSRLPRRASRAPTASRACRGRSRSIHAMPRQASGSRRSSRACGDAKDASGVLLVYTLP